MLAVFVGMLACGIGVFVTATFGIHPLYYIYKDVIGFEDNEPINEIGSR